jgi:asparagine synthase (glutamine-hydrolysing)
MASSGEHPWVERGVEAWRRWEEGKRFDEAGLARRYLRHLQIARAEEGRAVLAGDLRGGGEESLVERWRAWVGEVKNGDPFQRMLWLQSRTRLADYINCIVDRMSMHHSVEARPPLLDHTLWEFCAPLPRRLKVRGYAPYQVEKFLLREAGRGLVPEPARVARKAPWRVPYVEWMKRGRWPEWAEEALSGRALRALGVFDEGGVAALRRGFRAEPDRKGTLLMAVLTIQVWAGIFGCKR